MKAEQVIEEREKVKELINKLTPITDWANVKERELIFHKDSNSVLFCDTFISAIKDDVLDCYIVTYRNKELVEYNYYGSGWYFYDVAIAEKI